MRRRTLAAAPVAGAMVAIGALWRLELGNVSSAGWGWPGVGLVAVLVLGAARGSAALLGPWGRRRGGWLALALALAIAPVLGWARDRAHDDAAFARVRAAGSRVIIERYLRWGRHHRGEAEAMRAALDVADRERAAAARRHAVTEARARLAAAPGLEPAARAFLDDLLAAAADGPAIAVMTFRPPVVDAPVTVEQRQEEVYQRIATGLRALLPPALVRLDYGGRVDGDPAAPVSAATIEVAYQVRPWIVDGVVVTYAEDGARASLGLPPSKVFDAIELAFTIRLRAPGRRDGLLDVVVQPPERFDAPSLALLLDDAGAPTVHQAMVRHAFDQLGARLASALTGAP